jgi:hypothetical protein
MARYKQIATSPRFIVVDLERQLRMAAFGSNLVGLLLAGCGTD